MRFQRRHEDGARSCWNVASFGLGSRFGGGGSGSRWFSFLGRSVEGTDRGTVAVGSGERYGTLTRNFT